jgi:uncharacterized protein (DUF924 family)
MDEAVRDDVLAFWFGPLPHGARGTWFTKDAAFDAEIATRFGLAIDKALAGAYGEWCGTAHGALARILLLDQFTRNAYRGTPQSFAGDARALATARDAIARGHEAVLDPYERWFLYMPLEHSEDRAVQQLSLERFAALARAPGFEGPLDYARRHAAIIERFGRFPHRNAILGRPSTPEEIAFLREPGSAF